MTTNLRRTQTVIRAPDSPWQTCSSSSTVKHSSPSKNAGRHAPISSSKMGTGTDSELEVVIAYWGRNDGTGGKCNAAPRKTKKNFDEFVSGLELQVEKREGAVGRRGGGGCNNEERLRRVRVTALVYGAALARRAERLCRPAPNQAHALHAEITSTTSVLLRSHLSHPCAYFVPVCVCRC